MTFRDINRIVHCRSRSSKTILRDCVRGSYNTNRVTIAIGPVHIKRIVDSRIIRVT